MIQIYCYLSGRQADCRAVSGGLSPFTRLKSVKDYILACFESILQQTNQHPRHGLCIQNRINGHITSEVHFSSGPTGDTAALMFLPGLFHINCKKKE